MAADDQALTQLLNSMLQDVADMEAKLEQKKRLVNEICIDRGQPPRFTEVGGSHARAMVGLGSRRDQFYGKPLATAMREYLEMRGRSDRGGLGAATINEIYAALVDGGFKFETKNDDNAKRGLRDALSKNTGTFHSVGGAFGLVDWYEKVPRPERPPKKRRLAKKAKRKAPAAEPRKPITPDNVVDLKKSAATKTGDPGKAA